MAVKPVEYNHDSSTTGFAKVGDEKTITTDNANTIKKDEDQGFLNGLDKAQQTFLDGNVDTDTIEYGKDEATNTGKNKVDAKGAKENSDTVGTIAATGASVAAGLNFAGNLPAIIKGQMPAIRLSPFAGLVCGAIDVAMGAIMKIAADSFDSEYGNRMSKNSQAGDTNTTIQKYTDTLNSNVEAMGEESSKYTDLSSKTQDTNLDNVQQLAALQIQYNDLIAQGNTKGAADIKAQIDALKEGAATDPNADAMKECKDNIAAYQQNNYEATGVSDSGSSVAEFLGDGTTLGALGTVNTIGLTVGALGMSASAVQVWLGVFKGGPFAAIANAIAAAAAAVLFTVGAGLALSAAAKMGTKTKNEFDCAKKGSEIQSKVNDLNSQITTQSGETDAVSTGYTADDTAVATVTQKAQEAANKGVDASKTNTENNNKPKKPEAGVGAGAGAGAGVAA